MQVVPTDYNVKKLLSNLVNIDRRTREFLLFICYMFAYD